MANGCPRRADGKGVRNKAVLREARTMTCGELTPEEREPEVSMTRVLHITEPKKELRDAGQYVRGAILP